MRTVDIIAKKRDGGELTPDEIEFFVQGFTRGEIPDYQASAWAMAVFWRGMTDAETTALTLAMARSGETLDLHDVAPIVVDKHSTGGVGDKTTLAVGPVVASLGIPVGKMSGRGLSFSGGTLDKLESIAGWRAGLTIAEFKAQLRDVGLVVAGQTADLAPADGKLYALRDVTGTVPSLPLIASSIMSKKIASGADAIVLDVKTGRGAFMEEEAEALRLAELMLRIGRSMGRRMAAVISDMSQPLGRAVGNALEVREAVETLRGGGPPDFQEHTIVVSSEMLRLANRARDAEEGRRLAESALRAGRALAKFREFAVAQGGDGRQIDDPALLPRARLVEPLPAPRSGYLAAMDARKIGLAVVDLGGGRAKKGDPIDYAVGVVLSAKVGDRVEKGQPLLVIHANDEARLREARARLLGAHTWSDEAVSPPRLIRRVLG
ncbi:MAG: thymidine phosphorylase [Anaerolineae bacterium]|nr:thymidine phosphorylase [Anaerolineae bacterium]